MANILVSNNVVEGADTVGLGTYVAPVYGFTMAYTVKSPNDPPTTLAASLFKQVASGSTNVFYSFVINPDGTLTDIVDYATLAPSGLATEVKGMPIASEFYTISSADFDAVEADLGF